MFKIEDVLVKTPDGFTKHIQAQYEPLNLVLQVFNSVRIVMSDPTIEGLVYIDVDSDAETQLNSTILSQWVLVADYAKYLTKEYTTVREGEVTTRELDFDRIDIQPSNHNYNLADMVDEIPKPDLLVANGFMDYTDTLNHGLITVNGLIHSILPAADNGALYIKNGAANIKAANDALISIIDFKPVDGIVSHPIGDNIKKLEKHGVFLTIPAELTSKPYFVVLCGHMFMGHTAIKRVDTNLVYIDLHALRLSDLIINNHAALGLTKMYDELTLDTNLDDIYTEDVLMYILRQTESFLCFIGNEDVAQRKVMLSREDLPGIWSSPDPISGMIVYPNGRSVDYLQGFEDGRYVIKAPIVYEVVPTDDTTDGERQKVISGTGRIREYAETPSLIDIYKQVNS